MILIKLVVCTAQECYAHNLEKTEDVVHTTRQLVTERVYYDEKKINDINNCHIEREDRINLTVPKGERETIQNHAAEHMESTNQFIRRAIRETIAQDKAFAERKEEVLNGAKKHGITIEDESELRQLAEAFAALAPYLPNIQTTYFCKRAPLGFMPMSSRESQRHT